MCRHVFKGSVTISAFPIEKASGEGKQWPSVLKLVTLHDGNLCCVNLTAYLSHRSINSSVMLLPQITCLAPRYFEYIICKTG